MATREITTRIQPTLVERGERLRRSGEATQRFVNASRARASRVAYDSDTEHFRTWCESVGLASLPATPETVSYYFSALAIGEAEAFAKGRATRDGHWAATSIMRHKSSIGRMHRLADLPDPTEHERVKTTLKGIRRELSMHKERRRPLLDTHLVRLASLWTGDDLRTVRDLGLLLFGFMFAARCSELRALSVESLEFVVEGMLVHVGRSKGDQEGVGRRVGVPIATKHPEACPVAAVRRCLDRSGITTGPLFRPVHGKNRLEEALNTSDVERIVHRAVKALGLERPDEYGAHSLRAGFITSAARAGKDLKWIMAQSGHKTPAIVLQYIRDARLFIDNAADGLL